MNPDNPPGILALWNDCAPKNSQLYETWYQTEHLPERLAIPGFERGRRYESLGHGPQFFTYYETTSGQVLNSAAYLQRVNNPTELTSQVMSGLFTNMSRTACDVVYRNGRMRGGYACTVKLSAAPDLRQLAELWSDLAKSVNVARTELWVAADLPEGEATTEEKMRGGDSRIAACLFIETLRGTDITAVTDTLAGRLAGDAIEIGCYRLLCELETE